MTEDKIKYLNELTQAEHNAESDTKRVMLYGWDGDNLQAVRVEVDANGNLVTKRNDFEPVKTINASATLMYVLHEKSNGEWMVLEKDGDDIQYASIKNNPTITTYAEALTDYLTLTYGNPSEAL